MKNLLTAMLLLFSITIIAQPNPRPRQDMDPDERAQMMTEHMTEELDLTEEQAASVQQANLEFAQAMEEQRKNAQKQHEAHVAKIEKILNEEQLEKFRQMQKKHKEEHKMHHKKQKQYQHMENKQQKIMEDPD